MKGIFGHIPKSVLNPDDKTDIGDPALLDYIFTQLPLAARVGDHSKAKLFQAKLAHQYRVRYFCPKKHVREEILKRQMYTIADVNTIDGTNRGQMEDLVKRTHRLEGPQRCGACKEPIVDREMELAAVSTSAVCVSSA